MSIVLLSQISILLPVLSGLFFFKRLTRPFKLILYFFIFCIGVEYGAAWVSNHYKNNMPLLHAFTLVEIFVYCYIFGLVFNENKTFPLVCRSLFAVQVLMSVIDATLINGLLKFPSLSRTTGALILIFLTLYQLYIFLKNSNDPDLLKKARFWLLFGVLTYFSTIIFFLLFVNIVVNNDNETFSLIHSFHATVNILCNFIFAYSFICFRFKQD